MLKTRRQLDAENKALRARLGAAAGETRVLLTARMKAAEKLVGELREVETKRLGEITALIERIELLEARLLAYKDGEAASNTPAGEPAVEGGAS